MRTNLVRKTLLEGLLFDNRKMASNTGMHAEEDEDEKRCNRVHDYDVKLVVLG